TALPRSEDDLDDCLRDLLVGVASLFGGKAPPDLVRLRAVIDRAGSLDEPRWIVWAAIAAGGVGDGATGAVLLPRAGSLARASGSIPLLTVVLQVSTQEGLMAGNPSAVAEASEGLRLATDSGLPNSKSFFLAVLAWFAAVQGRKEECRAFADEAIDRARPAGVAIASSMAEWGASLLDLGAGRSEETSARPAARAAAPPGVKQPYISLLTTPDLVEACARTGRREQAQAAFELLGMIAQPQAPAWLRALAARCRALLAHGDEAAAEREVVEALHLHAEGNRPFERARTELLYGEFLRRARRRAASREQLRVALETFEHLRAEPWAERARGELRATGETARKRDPSTIDQLTPQELQIARLVGEGSS